MAEKTAMNMPDCAPANTPPFAHLLEQAVNVERTLIANPLPEALDEMIRALNRIDRFAAAPDALIRVDLHEQAAAHVAAFHIGNAQRGGTDAFFALSTACPNAARGRAAAAPASAHVGRNVRRPVVDCFISPPT